MLCNSGATLWLGGTTSLIDLYRLLFANRLLGVGRGTLRCVECRFLSFGFYEFCMIMEDLDVLSVGNVTYKKVKVSSYIAQYPILRLSLARTFRHLNN